MMMYTKLLTRGLIYFAIVFAAGFLLGIVRTLLIVPTVGERNAELLEMPFMLVVIIAAARFVVRRSAAASPAAFLLIGCIALGLLILAELMTIIALSGTSISQYIAQRDPVSGTVYLLMLLIFAAMPWLIARSRQRPRAA